MKVAKVGAYVFGSLVGTSIAYGAIWWTLWQNNCREHPQRLDKPRTVKT